MHVGGGEGVLWGDKKESWMCCCWAAVRVVLWTVQREDYVDGVRCTIPAQVMRDSLICHCYTH